MAITVVITVAMTTTAATVTTITTITTAWACCKSSTLTDALRLLVRGRRRRRRLAKNGELAARPCHLIANFILDRAGAARELRRGCKTLQAQQEWSNRAARIAHTASPAAAHAARA